MVNTLIAVFKAESNLQKCGCHHSSPDEFVKSQWQSRSKSNLFLAYRWFLAIFFTVAVIYSMVTHTHYYGPLGYYFIYLTNWGIILCMICNVMAAILVTIWHLHPEYADRIYENNEMPIAFKIHWSLHNITLILSLSISLLYWTVIHNETYIVDATNIMTHVFNSIFMFIDLIIVAYPVRLLHFIYPLVSASCYGLFSYFYYLAGGTDPAGRPYIYVVLDWTQPDRAFLIMVGVMVLLIVVHFLMFWIYKLRSFLYKKYFREILVISENSNSDLTDVSTEVGHNNPAYRTENSVK